ncbi:TRAP transporter substrate-binding protein DctP [Treponema parvum]|uniref:TRAP transporter substrate-binding protein DctP n=1 Tax=Treponema parvum TaxID=138851 RepID=A0A975F2W1_9SPIR|nr:C4-dicarboxylate TRAP transporter substrate-binding protein [Treponema parvum]QTQ13371.1 TRAP transporter substrate-binding protein DctP [Treponema parvum]
MKKMFTVVMMIAAMAAVNAAGSKDKATGGKASYVLKLSYVQNEEDPLTKGLYKLAESIKTATKGDFEIQVFPSGLLGDTADVVEQVKTGSNIGLLTDAGRFSGNLIEIGILDAPYLFDTYEEGNKIVQSDLFKSWTDRLQKDGYRVCSFNWYQGARNFITNKPIKSMADLKGLKIRTGSSPVWQATVDAFGCKPTSLAQGEVYSAIQQKVVDGAEQQDMATYGLKLYEVTKYITRTQHFQLMTGLVVSESWFQKLPESYRKLLIEESIKAGEYASNLTMQNIKRADAEMVKAGTVINEIDLAEFKAAGNKVYAKFSGFADIKKQIDKIIGK